jgi:hypothetical protein
MRASPRSILALGLLLAVPACKGHGDPVQELCELQLSCDCTPAPYADINACVTDLNDELEKIKADATANGLVYDANCIDDVAAEYTDNIECGATAKSDACSFCSPVHGTQPAGAKCTQFDEYYDCAQNLYCLDGVCVDPCNFLGEGSVCAVMKDGMTQGTGNCAKQLYCDYATTLTCKPRLGDGDPCPDFAGCAEGLTCDGAKCSPIPGEGDPCVFECKTDLVCDNGTCKLAPGVGEPCTGTCEADSECDGDTNFCVAKQPLICSVTPDQ